MYAADAIEKLNTQLKRDEDASAGAAVAIILNPEADELWVLLVKRSVNPSDPWSGDMAFPGGKRHPEDRSLRDTVVRETMEETGIDLQRCRFLGTMDALSSNIRPEMTILPFVTYCENRPVVTFSGELCSHFWVSLNQLKRSRCKARVRQMDVSAYVINGEVVWGLTYRMLERLLELLDKTM